MNQPIINELNNYDQFEDFRQILNSIDASIKEKLFSFLPEYVQALYKRLNNWKKVDVNNIDSSNKNSTSKKSRKILNLKR
jgi:hypothetical protein